MHSSISVSDSCNSDTSNSDEQGYNTGYSIDYDFGFCMSLPSQQLHRRCQFCRCAHCSGSRPHQGVSLCFSLQPHGNPRWVSQWLGLSSSGMSPCFRNPRQAPPQPSHPCGALSPNPRWVSLWLGLPGGGTIPSFRDPWWATPQPSHPGGGLSPDPRWVSLWLGLPGGGTIPSFRDPRWPLPGLVTHAVAQPDPTCTRDFLLKPQVFSTDSRIRALGKQLFQRTESLHNCMLQIHASPFLQFLHILLTKEQRPQLNDRIYAKGGHS